jgi:phage/plasmid-like protein (TIGR03299 family)
MTPVATLEDATDLYNMDFNVIADPLYYFDPEADLKALKAEVMAFVTDDSPPSRKKTKGANLAVDALVDAFLTSPYNRQIIHGKTFKPMAVSGMGYTTVEYPIAFSPAAPLIKAGARIVGGGCPNVGERAYLVLEGSEVIVLSPGDEIRNRYVLISSHDGTSPIEVRMTPFRPRTGTAMTFDTGSPLKFKHTKNVVNKVTRARQILKSVTTRWNEFEKGQKKMAVVSMTDQQARDFIEDVVPKSGKNSSKRRDNICDDIYALWKGGSIGGRLPQCKGTLFGLVGDIAEYCDHHRTVRKSNRRNPEACSLDAKLVKSSAELKQKAWMTALYLSTKMSLLSGALSK